MSLRPSSGVNIGGGNTAPIQNVVGTNISHVHQNAPSADDLDRVRELLAEFRRQLGAHPGAVADPAAVGDAVEVIENGLADPGRRGPRCGRSPGSFPR